MDVGIALPGFGSDAVEYARHAEGLGPESVRRGDHLIPVSPFLDATLVLATVAASTARVKPGFGVMVLPLRPVARAAEQVATLQHLSGVARGRPRVGGTSSGTTTATPGGR
ncbi:LLM class flavin-dependent oxidoreductase [Saccharothrix saharensis]|uniref:LLM class flavin-dependent oxidoreductase n=1 Tax=Saccharothrix saharensis TaxID=571190 RepID=UPI00114E9ADD|nr:LLM class flavin-dependent oxidoreductase [Saccharothrix saharensis]